MKTNHVLWLFGCGCLVTFAVPGAAQQQSAGKAPFSIDSPYQAPIRPGMAEWATFKSLPEKLAACDIPVAVTTNMTSDALVQTCFEHPLGSICLAYDHWQDGVSVIFMNFYGFVELQKRPDAGQALVKTYEKLANSLAQDSTSYQPGKWAYIHTVLERPEVNAKLSQAQMTSLTKLCLKNTLALRKHFGVTRGEAVVSDCALYFLINKNVVLQAGGASFDQRSLPAGYNVRPHRQSAADGRQFMDEMQHFAAAATQD
jgi:hypothetical protein